MFEKRLGQNPGILRAVCFDSLSQSIGRGRLSREGVLDVRESRERRDKIVPKFSPEKQEKCPHFFEQDRLLFARVDIDVTEFPTKTAEKEDEEEEENWG